MVNKALDNKKRVCAIGTTSMRAMESSVSANSRLKPNDGWTDRFNFPAIRVQNCKRVGNQLPHARIYIIDDGGAFGGYELVMKAYEEAIKEKYKFFSYGDVMLIL
jgi:S-adenosylmethionine:tRNA ribosyltransferase-isomerase